MLAGLSWLRILGDLVTFCASACAPELRSRLRICSCVSNSHSIKSVRSSPGVPTIRPPVCGEFELTLPPGFEGARCSVGANDMRRGLRWELMVRRSSERA
jgi:hypothetical protein